jgi:NADH-quinone oxidoreductase subunit G
MPKLTIDGMPIEVPAGTTILEAAKKLGRTIPYFCYHPKLSIPANCRQCLVEVAKAPKLLPGCYTTVAEGMEVQTQSPKVQEAQRRNMEFILLNHPVDCPICDQAGECKLQNYYQAYDFKPSRLNVLPVHKPKVIRLGAEVVLDAERCILCTRCIRFFEEIVGERPLGIFKRGEHSELGLYPGKSLPYGYARNVVDICPVGALTSEDFRFQKRVWFLTKTPSVCSGCARGCNITVEHHEGLVYRYRPRDNEAVNECWICDDGAYSYKAQRENRVLAPRLRQNGAFAEVKWDEALTAAAEALRAPDGGRPVGIVLSAQATCEANWAFVRLGREVLGDVRFYVAGKPDWEADKLLKVADQNPNTLGAKLVGGEAVRDTATLVADLNSRRLRALLLVGAELDLRLVPLLGNADRLVVVASNETAALENAQVVLAAANFSEQSGHFVNFEGRVQRLEAGPKPRGRSGPEWKIAVRLAQKLGKDFAWTGPEALFAEICELVPSFHGLSAAAVGPQGTPLPDRSRESAQAGSTATQGM